MLWALPGAAVQALGGPSRQAGVLFATGLLIQNAPAGWAALAALMLRVIVERHWRDRAETPMYVLAGGFLAGSALTSFGAATAKTR
jgi:uncharacterized oligopeptide transporter (OPT) family protein